MCSFWRGKYIVAISKNRNDDRSTTLTNLMKQLKVILRVLGWNFEQNSIYSQTLPENYRSAEVKASVGRTFLDIWRSSWKWSVWWDTRRLHWWYLRYIWRLWRSLNVYLKVRKGDCIWCLNFTESDKIAGYF